MREREILAEVLLALGSEPGWILAREHALMPPAPYPRMLVERMNTGAAQLARGRFVRFGSPGAPDIRVTVLGLAVAIEVKSESGRGSAQQLRWREAFTRAGGLYVLARSVEAALRGIDHAISQAGRTAKCGAEDCAECNR